jgi:nitroreductase
VDLNAAIARRRMCRSFLERSVDAEALDRALALATRAPSAGNTQGWAFVVLEGADTMSFWAHEADASWLAHPSHPGLLNAAAIVLPLASRASYEARYSEPDKAAVGSSRVHDWGVPYWLVDTAFATMLLLLGLAQEGLGALFFALRQPPGPLLDRLGVPSGWEPLGAVALGWPSPEDKPSTSAARPRRTVNEVVHRGGW